MSPALFTGFFSLFAPVKRSFLLLREVFFNERTGLPFREQSKMDET